MHRSPDPLIAVRQFHAALPDRIRLYLNGRGIPDAVIDHRELGWDDRRITIPIFDREGRLAFVKRAKDPEDQGPGPKMLCPPGAHSELYGWERLLAKPPRIVICEGEFDRLVLEAQGIAAVTSTGGARLFRPAWAEDFEPIEEVFVCYDRDEAGRAGALRVGQLIPKSRLVELPEEVGEGGDVTDFFVRLGKTREEFLALLETAQPAPRLVEDPARNRIVSSDRPWSDRVMRLKESIPIAHVVGEYVQLRPSGSRLVGHCPFHIDREPSFMVFPAQGRFHCFGCGADGDVIAFLMTIEHLSFRQALDTLGTFNRNHGEEAAQGDR